MAIREEDGLIPPYGFGGYVSDDILRQVASRLAEIGEPIDTPAKEAEALADIMRAREEYIRNKKGMRERKYKFWDKHNKVWVGPYTLKQLADEDQFSSDREWQPICSKWECFECVEYIGRKDCKRQEIYEGDIVQHEGSQGVVTWCETAPQFIPFPSARMLDNRWEVIGNIYENPELIKEQ